MLPGSTSRRKERDGLKKDGRSVEIQRLIGRSLRAAVDLTRLGERTIYIDCDVLQADGGTRTASITGGFAALTLACQKLLAQGLIADSPVVRQVAAVSVGIVDDTPTPGGLVAGLQAPAVVDDHILIARVLQPQVNERIGAFAHQRVRDVVSKGIPGVPAHRGSVYQHGDHPFRFLFRAVRYPHGYYMPKGRLWQDGRKGLRASRTDPEGGFAPAP